MRLGRRHHELAAELFAELAEPFAVALADEERILTRLQLAGSLDRKEACVEAFADLEPWVAWDEATLSARVGCYTAADHPLLTRARRELAEWRSRQPPALDEGLPPVEGGA